MEDVHDQIRASAVCMQLAAEQKTALIEEMVDAMVAQGKLDGEQRRGVARLLLERERRMATGLQDGVAVPHAKCGCVKRVVSAFGLSAEGVDFEAEDGKPARIFVLVVAPEIDSGVYLRFLARVCRALSCPAVRERMMELSSADELRELLVENTPGVML